jgi:hypothetical protein
MGAGDVSCLIGKDIIKNKFLQMIEMNEVDREIILTAVPSDRADKFLEGLNTKFHFDKKPRSVAFTLPVCGGMRIKRDASPRWSEDGCPAAAREFAALLLIVDKGKEETAVQICHDAGYYGGTIIKAHGSAGKLSVVLDMMVEPEKAAILMPMPSTLAERLAPLLREKLRLDEPNTGILIPLEVRGMVGFPWQNKRLEAL